MTRRARIYAGYFIYSNRVKIPTNQRPAPGVGKEILVNVPMELENELSSVLAGLAKQKAGLKTEHKKHVEKPLTNSWIATYIAFIKIPDDRTTYIHAYLPYPALPYAMLRYPTLPHPPTYVRTYVHTYIYIYTNIYIIYIYIRGQCYVM